MERWNGKDMVIGCKNTGVHTIYYHLKFAQDFDWVQLQRIDNDLPVTTRLRSSRRVQFLRSQSRNRNEFRVEDPDYSSLRLYFIVSTLFTYFLFWLKQQIVH